MSDLLKENRFITFARRLSRASKIFLTSFILLSIIIFWYSFVYNPIRVRINEQSLILKNNTEYNFIFKNNIKNFSVLEQESNLISAKIQKSISEKISLQDNVNSVLTLLKNNGLNCHGFEPLENKQRDFYKKEYFSLKAKANFNKFLNFLNGLEKDGKLIKFRNLNIERKKRGTVLITANLRLVDFLNTLNKRDDRVLNV